MNFRIWRRNLYPATALSAQTVTSQTEKATVGVGVRLYVYCSAVTAGGGTDSVSLMAVPPNGGTAVTLATFSKVNMLSAAGTLVFDFRPGATGEFAASGLTFAAGAGYGAAGISIPLTWAVSITLGTGNSATVAVDAEILP